MEESTLKGVKGGTRGCGHHLVGGVHTKGSQKRCTKGVTIRSEDYTPRRVKGSTRGWGFHQFGGVFPQESQRRCKRVELPSGRRSVPTGESKEVNRGVYHLSEESTPGESKVVHGGGVTIWSVEFPPQVS